MNLSIEITSIGYDLPAVRIPPQDKPIRFEEWFIKRHRLFPGAARTLCLYWRSVRADDYRFASREATHASYLTRALWVKSHHAGCSSGLGRVWAKRDFLFRNSLLWTFPAQVKLKTLLQLINQI